MKSFVYLIILSIFFTSCGQRHSYVVRERYQERAISYERPYETALRPNERPYTTSYQRPSERPYETPYQRPSEKAQQPPRPLVEREKKPKVAPKTQKPKVVEPQVAMPVPVAKKKPYLIILDAGHGGKDTGALSKKNGYEEKSLTLLTVNLIKNQLTELGYEVKLTRHKDMFVSLEDRAVMANKMKAALFVSMHYNFSPSDSAEGIEIFYYKDEKNPYTKRLIESKKLGENVLVNIVKKTKATSRGVKKANFAVIRETKMPAILIEGGFLSNPGERKKILDLNYLRFMAQGIASGIDHYLDGIKDK